MSDRVVRRLRERFGDDVLEFHNQFGDDTAVVTRSRWREIALFLRDDPKCKMDHFIDITAVDYLGRMPRFDLVLHVRSTERQHRVRLKTRLGDDDGNDVEVESLVPVWIGADWFERETFDMFGIQFVGHPDLRRILMYPEFKGYPLRKDYPANRIQPLVEYRDVVNKLPPFGKDEGMSFGRQTHEYFRDDPLHHEEN